MEPTAGRHINQKRPFAMVVENIKQKNIALLLCFCVTFAFVSLHLLLHAWTESW